MKKKLYLYIVISVVVLGTAGYFLFFSSDSDDVKYRTEKVSRGEILVQVRATGTINPVRTVQVGTQVSGIIEKIYVDFNSVVQEGQPIAQIDSTFLYASVKEVEANYDRNRAQLNEAQRNLNRTTELSKKNLVSQADLDAAQTAFEAAQAQLKQSEGSLERARVNLRYAVVRSPIDGIVVSRDVDVGQTVASSFQTPKMFQIAQDLRDMQVEASVDEADIGQVKTGQSVTFTVDAYSQEQFQGQVIQVRLAPVIVQNVVTYTVIIGVKNDDMKLRPGMTATATILVDKRENVLRVPTLAIRFQPPSDVLETLQSKGMDAPEQKEKGKEFSDENSVRSGGEKEKANQGIPSRKKELAQKGNEQNANDSKWKQNPEKIQSRKNTARVWVLEDGKNLKSLTVQTGLADSRFIEILQGEIKEGDQVIIGVTGNGNSASNQQQTNPFGPQRVMMGGGGGGRDRR